MYRYDPKEDPTDDCFRAGGDLWRVLEEDKKEILIQNTAADIAPCTVNIKYRHAAHCYLPTRSTASALPRRRGWISEGQGVGQAGS